MNVSFAKTARRWQQSAVLGIALTMMGLGGLDSVSWARSVAPADVITQDQFTSGTVAPLEPRVGTWTVAAGALQANTVSVSGPDAQDFATLPTNVTNYEESATITVEKTTGPWRVGLIAHASLNPRNTDKWAWIIEPHQVALLDENVGWVATAPFNPVVGQAYHMVMLVDGTTVDGKIWAAGQAEPSTWTLTGQFAENATIAATGGGIYCARAQADVQDLTLTTPPPDLIVSPDQPGGVFRYGQPIEYTAIIDNPTAESGEYLLSYTLTPLQGGTPESGSMPVFVDANQSTAVPIALNPPPHGYDTLIVNLSTYQSGQPLETSPPIGVGVVPNPQPLTSSDALGINANLTMEASDPSVLAHRMQLMADAGLGWYRLEFDGQTMANPTEVDPWTATNAMVRAAQQANLSILGLLTAWPPGEDPFGANAKVSFAQALSDESQWVQSVVNEYRPGGTLADAQGWGSSYGISAWELWNEPTTVAYWPGTAQQYAEYAQTVAQAINTVDPGATILAYADQPATLLQTDNPPAFNALSVHYYPGASGPNNPTDSVYGVVTNIQNVVAASPEPSTPLWITETGWSTDSVSVVTQAEYEVRAAVEALTQGVQKVFFFTQSYPGSGFGIEHGDMSPKPAYVAIATLARRIAGFTPEGSATLNGNTTVELWQNGFNTLAILWSGHGTGTLTLPSSADGYVTGWTWMDQSLQQSLGNSTVTINQQPTYLQFANTPPSGVLSWLQQAAWSPSPS